MALMGLALFGLAAVVLITICVMLKLGERVDAAVLDRVHACSLDSAGNRRKKADTVMRDLTALGGDTATVLLALAGSAALLARGDDGLLAPFLLTLASARGAGWLMKRVIRRQRPSQDRHTFDIFTSSFPSVHTAMSFVSTFAIVFFLATNAGGPSIAITLAAIVSGMVGATRLCFAVHWPLDVLAGWFTGLTISAATAYLITG